MNKSTEKKDPELCQSEIPVSCSYFNTLKNKMAPQCCRCRSFRSTGLAEVKWCRKNINKSGALYTAGLKYYQAPY